jgi:hypothetical protein
VHKLTEIGISCAPPWTPSDSSPTYLELGVLLLLFLLLVVHIPCDMFDPARMPIQRDYFMVTPLFLSLMFDH